MTLLLEEILLVALDVLESLVLGGESSHDHSLELLLEPNQGFLNRLSGVMCPAIGSYSGLHKRRHDLFNLFVFRLLSLLTDPPIEPESLFLLHAKHRLEVRGDLPTNHEIGFVVSFLQ